MKTLFTPALGTFTLRITLGSVFLAHGAFKSVVLGLPQTAEYFAAHRVPAWAAYPVFVLELVAGVMLLAGFRSRWAALALIPVATGALLVHVGNGWYFGAPNGGWEYPAVLIAGLFAQVNLGDGAFALDRTVRLRPRRRLQPNTDPTSSTGEAAAR